MQSFSEYEKIHEQFKNISLPEKTINDLHKLKWVVTEKVHGANFSFIYEQKKLKFAKRKEYLRWTDDFFGFQLMVQKMEAQLLLLFEQLDSKLNAFRYIVYGELFGGEYPHPSVPRDPFVKAIQTGVYYAPSVEFYAFDIAIEPDSSGSKYYLDYEIALSLFERFELYHAKSLFTGKLNDALSFDTRINSVLPIQLSLPLLSQNLIEGIVLKPLQHSSVLGPATRPILKIKNAEFNEQEKFHQAQKWSYIPSVTTNTESLGFITEEMNTYITKNRLNSVLSKTGHMDLNNQKRMEEIRQEFILDIWIDFNVNNANLLLELSPSQQEWVRERLKAMVSAFLNR